MPGILVNLHMYTRYSDGSATQLAPHDRWNLLNYTGLE